MRSLPILLLLFLLQGCAEEPGPTPEVVPAPTADASLPPDGPEAPETPGPNALPAGSPSVEALCTALAPALQGRSGGLDRYATPEVLAGLNDPAYAETGLYPSYGTCVTGAGDAETLLGLEERDDGTFYATGLHTRPAGDYAYMAMAETAPETCAGLGDLPSMNGGTLWRDFVGVYATGSIARMLVDLDETATVVETDGITCVVSSDGFGDAELVLHLVPGKDSELPLAVATEYRMAGDAAGY